jgi:preprotein translocase subunit SecG
MSDPQNPDVPTPPPGYGQTPPPASGPTPPPPSYGETPPPAAQPTYSSAPPAPYGAPSTAAVPGKTLGIVAFVVAIFFNVIGLIMGIVALVQSRKAGYKNGWAVAAIVVGAILTVVGIIIAILVFTALAAGAGFANEVFQACQAVDFTGTVTVQDVTVDCATITR